MSTDSDVHYYFPMFGIVSDTQNDDDTQVTVTWDGSDEPYDYPLKLLQVLDAANPPHHTDNNNDELS